jgi:hypothetical protein
METRSRLYQVWTIAKIELGHAFFSKRAFWVYFLALLPAIIFLGHNLQVKFTRDRLSAAGQVKPALVDGIQQDESPEAIIQRLGKPAQDYKWESRRRVRNAGDLPGVTTHTIEPPYEARFIRLNILAPAYNSDRAARIYEFEVYGEGATNLALRRPATGSLPCSADEGPEKAFNGSVKGGIRDRWCSREWNRFLQVDLGQVFKIKRIILRHAGAGGESEELNTALFNVQASSDDKLFGTIVNPTGARYMEEITARRRLVYFDGTRQARLQFADGKLTTRDISPLLNFEEDRQIFAGVFQFFYLRLAIFFGCLGIFMNLFRGEMLDRTLHFWLLAPVRREVLLAGKYAAGLIASATIFACGTLLCQAILLWTHNAVEVGAYWQQAGLSHVFWYTAAAVLGCIGYGSVFLATGLLLRNPIIPAAVLLGWEGINGFLPEWLQKLSVLYYLQSVCPVPAPLDKNMPALLQLLLAPAAPASRTGSILGLFLVTLVVLWAARLAVRRMQISYSTE